MAKFNLVAEKRDLFGKKLKKLRKQGILPGNLFGKDTKSVAIQVKTKDFERLYKEAGETSVIYIKIEGEEKERPVLVSDLHFNPITDTKLHVDFHQVNLKEKVTAHVPVEIVGEPEIVKSGAAILSVTLNEIEIEALPTDIPENITFDVSNLNEIGAMLKVSDAKVSSDVEIKTDPEISVVSVSEPQKEEVVEAPVAEVTEGEPTKVAGEESVTGAEKAPASENAKAE